MRSSSRIGRENTFVVSTGIDWQVTRSALQWYVAQSKQATTTFSSNTGLLLSSKNCGKDCSDSSLLTLSLDVAVKYYMGSRLVDGWGCITIIAAWTWVNPIQIQIQSISIGFWLNFNLILILSLDCIGFGFKMFHVFWHVPGSTFDPSDWPQRCLAFTSVHHVFPTPVSPRQINCLGFINK